MRQPEMIGGSPWRDALITLICLLGAVPHARAGSLDGAAILAQARAGIAAGGSRSAEFVLDLQTRSWRAEREGRIYTKYDGDGRKMLIIFDAPAHVRDVKLLRWQPSSGPATQWLYTPSSHRARRMAAGETGRSVFGTDFSGSDLDHRGSGVDAVVRRRESREGLETYVVEVRGREDDVPIHEILWIRTTDFRVVRREFYVDGTLDRVFTADEFQVVDGITTPVRMTFLNIVADARSSIRLTHVRYGLDLDPALFAIQQMDSRIASLGDGRSSGRAEESGPTPTLRSD